MKAAPLPHDEPERLATARSLGLFGTPSEERFDHIVRLARAALRVSYAAFHVLGEDVLWVKAFDGAPGELQVPREQSFCQWAILEDGVATIEDTKADPRTSGAARADEMRFYAARPVTYAGRKIGVICVGGPAPRALQPDEATVLDDLAMLVEQQLTARQLGEQQLSLAAELAEARASAAVDSLTRVWSRPAIKELAGRELQRGRAGILMVDVDHFKKVNDTLGHQGGDVVLRTVADRLKNALRGADAVGRYGGEEFLVVLPGCESAALQPIAERLRLAISRDPIEVGGVSLTVTASIGGAIGDAPGHHAELVLRGADEALYSAKEAGRNRVVTRVITPSLHTRAAKLTT